MQYCQFTPIDQNGHFVCAECNTRSPPGIQYPPEGPPPRFCLIQEPPYDADTAANRLVDATHQSGILDHLPRWQRDLQRWQAAGFPIRPDEDLALIVHEICPHCVDGKYLAGRCTQCPATGQEVDVLGKMGTAACPLNHW